MRLLLCLILISVASATLVGCGGSDRSDLGKVSGTVSYRGTPVSDGKIIFEVPGARAAYGQIVNGEIADVTTYDVGDGVPVGTAKVAVFADRSAGDVAAPPLVETQSDPSELGPVDASYMGGGGTSLLPTKYNNPSTSDLRVEITAGTNRIELDLID